MLVKNILLDCDNTLVRSEKLAFAACCALLNEVLASKGVSRRFKPAELMHEYVGQTFRSMLIDLSQKHNFVLDAVDLEELVMEEEDRVIQALAAKVRACGGSTKVLERLSERKYNLAVVSSSALRRVRACLIRTGQDRYIPVDQVYSAANSLPTPKSKPAPDVYLHALADMKTRADVSLAVEDSRSGVLSAVAADIPVVGYVGAYPMAERPKVRQALHDAGAFYVIDDWKRFPKVLKAIESGRLLVTGCRPRSPASESRAAQ